MTRRHRRQSLFRYTADQSVPLNAILKFSKFVCEKLRENVDFSLDLALWGGCTYKRKEMVAYIRNNRAGLKRVTFTRC